ncbi:holin [Bifidobacterium phage BadAztec1]|uniref:Holin n=2 Tax=Badaztecvirus badaztec1 TaxID=2843847 RepID=A0A6G6Y029_9CAUD|nr:holin [Bifidobacterium phage BadAztec1]QIG78011.1 hypothetical protein BAAZ0010002c01_00003 [Bifidobacterium phage BadAztec1]QIG78257.1 hypothetical protein BAAZ0010004c01_00009 [Bifidobacterium phage BadAztec4]QIG78275.1 hypothetical protein BAAZ0010003c01_00003 [Bifidobacterium phage BadAztec2]
MANLQMTGEIALVTFAFILADIITGYLGAWASRQLSSSKMRKGLVHKATLCIIMALGALIDFAQSRDIVNLGYDIPMFEVICIYIIFMEINSIIENVGIIFPDLKDSKLLKLFKNNQDYLNSLLDSENSKAKDSTKIERSGKPNRSATTQTPDLPPAPQMTEALGDENGKS